MRAVLFIHGLSAKKEDNQYFIDKMKKFSNIDIYTFTLPGHEENKMTKVKYQDWITASEKELNSILKKYKKVTIVSHSMGTIIAVYLASKYKQIENLVLIAPAFIFGSFKQNKKDLGRLLKKEVDEELGTGFEGSLTKFFQIPKSVMMEYLKMASKNKENISKVSCPTLIIHGLEDNVIPVKSSEFVYQNLTCKKDLVLIRNVRHQVFKSKKKDMIINYIYRFISFKMLYTVIKKKVI